MTDQVFGQWQLLRSYISCMKHSVGVWNSFFKTHTIDWLSYTALEEWLKRLITTLEVFEVAHVYDDLEPFNITSQSSGFPSRRHLDQLALEQSMLNDTAFDCQENSLKRNFLDVLFSTKRINIPLLEKISKESVKLILSSSNILLPFRFNGVTEVNSTLSDKKTFVCAWEQYTLQPLPVKYVMLFETSGGWSLNEKNVNALARVLQEETSFMQNMEKIARNIDLSNAHVHPKWVGRVILGPVFISGITQNDHKLQHVLDATAKEGLQSASRIIYEYVVSEKEIPIADMFDSNAERHTCLQRFAVRKDGEYFDRGVTHLEKHLFAPHKVIQELDDAYRKEIGHELNSY